MEPPDKSLFFKIILINRHLIALQERNVAINRKGVVNINGI
jgi:hypothetical protein